MQILNETIDKPSLNKSANIFDGPMVKGVVDIKRELLAIDAPMHADLEQFFLENSSVQDDLWGINLWYEDDGDDFVEFDSMINIRPRQGNRSRSVENPETQKQILRVVSKWIQ